MVMGRKSISNNSQHECGPSLNGEGMCFRKTRNNEKSTDDLFRNGFLGCPGDSRHPLG
jgi:hypothetical protein|tara:strand:- start:152 stop:325 length:174 start_codon:yes stop_codon:yes gene_type:complete